jgi:hypothetical protein
VGVGGVELVVGGELGEEIGMAPAASTTSHVGVREGRRLVAEGFLVVVAVIVAVAAALVGPVEGRAAADEPARRGRASGGSHDTGDSAPRSAAPSFLLDRGRYLRFDHPLVGDETAANAINDREVIAGGYYDVDGGTQPNPSATEAMPMDVASTPAMPVGS